MELHQTKFAGMLCTKEEIQVEILAGIPVGPSLRPVRPSKIASVVTKNLDGTNLARLISRIKYEFRAAFRRGNGICQRGLLLLWPFHLVIGLETELNMATAKVKRPGLVKLLSVAAAPHRTNASLQKGIRRVSNHTV